MTPSLGKDCAIDVDKLVESRLLIQANSGGGKSWAIRRLLEQTYGKVQQILIDVDGEFHTLREKFDYVLAGQKNGDCPADIKSAALLARRLLELNVSTIVDIYELGSQKKLFVRRFLDALVNAPRELWHPVLIVIDEAHIFAPEAGQAESASAVIDLMTLGRKRGFCGVLATQRISKLHKDAAAECNNKLIGRSALDIDMKRAASELGFTTREDTHSLRTLKAGDFYAFGPAISDEVRLIKVGNVKTTHLKAGQRAAPPTPPSDKVKKLLAQLADLPHEAEEEAKTVNELRAQVKQLQNELKRAQVAPPVPKVDVKAEKLMRDMQLAQAKRLETLLDKGDKLQNQLNLIAVEFKCGCADLKPPMFTLPVKQPTQTPPGFKIRPVDPLIKGTAQALRKRDKPNGTPEKSWSKGDPLHHAYASHPPNDALPVGEAATLRALIQYPNGLDRSQLTVLTGYKRSTRDAYIARLREKGLVETNLVKVFVTDAGRDAMPDAEPLPTGEALRDFWFTKLPSGEKQVLQQLVEAYPDSIDKPTIDDATGFKRSTRDAYLSRLAAKQLVIDVGRGAVKASDTLFEVDA